MPTRAPNPSSSPVFIVGMNGSGTTMLLDCLGHHTALYYVPFETRFIPSLALQLDRFGDLHDDANFERLWNDVLARPVIQRTGMVAIEREPTLPEDWRSQPRSLAGILDRVFSDFARAQGKRHWCEKTPQHVQHLSLLAEMFPAARFVHVIRDGRDCAASLHRRYGRRPEHTVFRWTQVVREGRRQGRTLGERYFELKYEELTAGPEAAMRRLCEFLGVGFEPAVLQSRRPRNPDAGRLGEVKGTIEAKPPVWTHYFTRRRVTRMETYAGDYLRELGYPTVTGSRSRAPGTLRLACWKWSDRGREFVRLLVKRVRRERTIPWQHLKHTVTTALAQSKANRY